MESGNRRHPYGNHSPCVSWEEQFRIPKIYSVLSELKGRDVLLSSLYFSITGAMCYSRQIEETLRSLMEKLVSVLPPET